MEKKYDHSASEAKIRALWEAKKVYATAKGDGPLYSIDTPPPTVSGKLHIGHIFSYTQTDIIARFKRMSGFSVFYPFGFDDNGLPTAHFVEKKRKISAFKMGREAFIEGCLEETVEVEKKFKELWSAIGLSVDWDASYATISPMVRKISQASFIDLYKKGFIYRKEEPALYCTKFRSSVSQADLEDVEQETFFTDIAFKDEQGNDLVIGTTRPELLASCVALFFHPSDKRYTHLLGKKAIVPLYGHEVTICADEKVQVDKGTGLVMCCTFGDKTDIEWFKKHELPYKQSIGFDGKMLEIAGPLAGLPVKEARAKVLELLEHEGVVKNQKKIVHPVSVYERSKREIEYVMLPQWFLKILPYKKDLLNAAESINWYPSFMKARFIDWVENLQWDWCLSRQRFFGIPFPVWFDSETGEILVADEKDLPIDPQATAYPGRLPEGRKARADTDVMDTWNTSSLTPYLCQALYQDTTDVFSKEAQKSDFIPMGMRPQAHDIIRTWAFYTIVKSWMHQGSIPWKDIVISGHVLSPENEKISKSRGNNPLDPENLLKNYSADVIRYWTASGTLGHDVAFSENQLKIGRRLTVKLWNACRFAFEHLKDFEPKAGRKKLDPVDEWILTRASQTFKRYTDYFEKYEFSLALAAAEEFFWHDVCDNYLELIKDQLFKPEQYDESVIEGTKWTLYNVMLRTLQFFAPYLPYITEDIYQIMYKQHEDVDSIHRLKFDAVQKEYDFSDSARDVSVLLDVVAEVRRLKTDRRLALNAELADVMIVAEQEVLDRLRTLEDILKGVVHARAVGYATKSVGTSFLEERDGLWSATVCLS